MTAPEVRRATSQRAWDDLLKLARAGDTVGTVRLVTEFDAAGRKAVAARLSDHVTEQGRAGRWWDWPGQCAPLMVAGVACLGGPAAVAAWLFRPELRWAADGDLGCLPELLRRRPAGWRADLARRVAARVRLPELRHWALAAELVRETGIEPPDDAAFMAGWLRALSPAPAAGDRLFTAYRRRVFEIDGLATADLWRVVESVVRLVADGRLERAAVIDGLVRRLLRDGPGAPVPFAVLHDRLDLDLDEAARRAADYAALLPAGPVAVADLALAQLRRLEESGRLAEELFAEAVAALAFRPEKKLLRAVVSWAGDAVLRDAGRVPAVLRAMSSIFTQDTLALREQAVRLAVKLAPQADQAAREVVREAAAGLPAELREQIAPAYGGGIAEQAALTAAALTAGHAPSLPGPIASPEELAREIAAFDWPPDPYTYERLLAGLADWSHRAPWASREALRAWWQPFEPADYGHFGSEIDEGLVAVVRRAFLAFASPGDSRALTAESASKRRRPRAPGALDRIYLERARELATAFEQGTGYPVLLATPTRGTGHVDPGVLLDRLELLEAGGAAALPADLAQALLRLPRVVGAVHVRRAGRLTSEAGRACAAWMRGGGLADPRVTVSVHGRAHLRAELDLPSAGLASAGLLSAGPPPAGLPSAAPLLADLPVAIRELFELQTGHSYTLGWWPLVLPSHRELVAAHLSCYLPASMAGADRQTAVLASVVHGDGPLGAGMAHALACGMGHENAADRGAATDALLTLAARGEVPVVALAEAVTRLVRADFLKLNRVVAVLDDATQAGAQEVVWEVVVRVLPGLLPAEGERPRAGVADLLAAGARAARIAGVRAEVPEVAAVAARTGSSRLVQEARRLWHLITSPKGSTL
ncbi:DUF6493 family protein [Nonomuraea sp. B12E4]|uniref:DUF6493 family protein n=1 Tax=Nonomuraea sp. B12E4 TaxID=3153564 RepID=UPI00325EFEEC